MYDESLLRMPESGTRQENRRNRFRTRNSTRLSLSDVLDSALNIIGDVEDGLQ